MKIPDKKKKTKHIKKTNLYIPCIDNITTNEEYFEEWYKYSKQFTDPFTFGKNKFHKYPKNDKANSKGKVIKGLVELAQSHDKKPYYSRQIRKSDYGEYFHNPKNNFTKLYTTNHFLCSVWSSILDIDPVKLHHHNYIKGRATTVADITACKNELKQLTPHCYYQNSTNGLGLHYKILIDCEKVKQDYTDRYPNMNYTYFVNSLISNKSDDMNNPSFFYSLKKYLEGKYYVSVDAFKSTYSSYEWNDEYNIYVVTNMGVLCLLPLPSMDNFHYLIHSHIYSLSELESIRENIVTLTSSAQAFFPIGKRALANKKEQEINTTHNYITIMLSLKVHFKADNKDWYGVGQRTFREYLRQEKRNPTKEEVREVLTQLGEVDERKLDKLYKCIIGRVDESKLHLGRYLEKDKERYKEIDIEGTLKKYGKKYGSSYTKLNITPMKISVGMDYIRNIIISGCGKDNAGRRLTVSTDAMAAHSTKLWKKGMIKRKDKWSNAQLSRAIRYMLEEYGDVEKLNANHSEKISMRYMIEPQYHSYNEIEAVVNKDEDVVSRIRAKGLASLENWSDMGSVG